MQRVVQAANLLDEAVDFARFLIRAGSAREVLLLLLLEHGSQLEDLLMLLILGLVVISQLPLGVFDVILDEAAFIVRSLDVSADSLHLRVFLIGNGLGVHDVTVNSVAVLAKISVVALEGLKLFLKN